MRDIPEASKNYVDERAGPSAAIEVRQLSKRVADASGELTILHSVDFTVQPAETLAIVGASGSGKSTLLGLLAGLDSPSSGTVILDGVDIFALDEDGRAQLRMAKLGFVFQSFQLLAHLTALENVMLPLELRGDADARAKATAMLGRVGLSSRLKHYPKFLSGGEQQRVALARAFVTEPPLLFADEPTGSLDAATGEAVIRLMFELNRERGSTLVLVTHDAAMAARCALLKDRCHTTVELADWIAMFFTAVTPAQADLDQHVTDVAKAALRTLREKLETVAWDKASLAAAMKETLAAHGIKMPQLAIPLRVIVSGRAQTPAIDALLALFQREVVLDRLRTI